MDEIIKLSKELRESIDQLEEVQEYYRVKAIYDNDEELKRLRHEIARLKSEGKEEERKNLLALYNSHPLVVNYNASKEEVMSILRAIQDIIQ